MVRTDWLGKGHMLWHSIKNMIKLFSGFFFSFLLLLLSSTLHKRKTLLNTIDASSLKFRYPSLCTPLAKRLKPVDASLIYYTIIAPPIVCF